MKGSYEKPSITSINNGGDVNPTGCTFFFAVLVLALAIAAGGVAAAAAAVWAAAWYSTSTSSC